jgi:hypothetical protein
LLDLAVSGDLRMEDDYGAAPVTIERIPQQILFAGCGGRKAPCSMGKISAVGVLRLRATTAVSRNKSVRRSAQDDAFVGILTDTS